MNTIVRLARLDLTLLWRNRTALLSALGVPALFGGLLLLPREGNERPGLTAELYTGTGNLAFFLLFAVFVNLTGVFTARREDLSLKRLRSAALPDREILGGSVLAAAAVYLAMAALMMLVIGTALGAGAPADPVLLLTGMLLGVVIFALLAITLAGLTPTAELAQWTVLPVVLLSMAGSGFMIPLADLPDGLQRIATLVPMSPIVDILRTAYLGQDHTYGGDHKAVGVLAAWRACGPALLIALGWVAVAGLLARRCLRWEPRSA